MIAAMPTDEQLAAVLEGIVKGEDAGIPADNESLAAALGWDLELIAECLRVAKEHSYIWGFRGSRKPTPWFSDLEATVQGRRYLRTWRD